MLIGLHGKKQAGKDTACERLGLLLGRSDSGTAVQRVSFADLLYKSAAAAIGVSVDFLREWKSDTAAVVEVHVLGRTESRNTFREYLQQYGTEAHRHVFGDNFWVDQVNLADHAGRVVVVTDVRFRNEAQAVVDAGGTVVHVIGPPDVEDAGDGHVSEETLPAFLIDLQLMNAARHDDFAALDSAVQAMFLRLLREGGGRC